MDQLLRVGPIPRRLHCQWVSTASWSGLGALSTCPQLGTGTPSSWSCRSCVCCHSLCLCVGQSCCASKTLLPLSHSSPLLLRIFPPPVPYRPLSREGGEFDEDISFRTKCSEVSQGLHIVKLWVCVSSHLLQETASLTTADLSPILVSVLLNSF